MKTLLITILYFLRVSINAEEIDQSILSASGYTRQFDCQSLFSDQTKKASGNTRFQIGRVSNNGPSFLFSCDYEKKIITYTTIKDGKITNSEKFNNIDKSVIDDIEKIAEVFPLRMQSMQNSALAMLNKDGAYWLFEYNDLNNNTLSQVVCEDLSSAQDQKSMNVVEGKISSLISKVKSALGGGSRK